MWAMLEERLFAPLRSDRAIKAALPRSRPRSLPARLRPPPRSSKIVGMLGRVTRCAVLLIGFGPFPGAPFNPSALAR